MANFLGTCRSCEFTIFATEEDLIEAKDFGEIKAGRAGRIPERGVFARCILNHKVFPLGEVEGTYSEKHKCDSRCLSARGRKCTCSCGGANHGRGHAVTISKADEEREMIHLGEVGKHIVGEVTVQQRKDFDGIEPILYVFLSKNGTGVIKWWVPTRNDPGFKVGEEMTIRAKVRRHDEHERWGKSTIVTYVERIENGSVSA